MIIAGIAAQRRQAIGGKRQIAGLGDPPRDILDIGIKAPVFMHDDDTTACTARRRFDVIAADRAMAVR